MPTNVDTFKKFTEFVANKVQSGGSISSDQFNLVAHRAQMQLFEKDYGTFLQSGQISEFLNTFLVNYVTNVPPTTGAIAYPSDYEHLASMRRYYVKPTGSQEIPIEEVKDISWGEIYRSQLLTPTLQFPKFNAFATEFRFLPKNVGIVMVDYFKTPVAPVWGYTIVNNAQAYDSSTSTDFEWDEYALNNVAAIYLSLVGVNIKDMELSQFAEMYKAQTNSLL